MLLAAPLFLLMGEILLRAGLSDRLHKALNVWLNQISGGLLHANIVSRALFSAIAGSSVATAATMGAVAVPYFQATKYSQRMVLGSLVAGEAPGDLMPPRITFITYGLITETSVGVLSIAALIPSLLVTGLFMLVILAQGLILFGAYLLNSVLTLINVPQALVGLIAGPPIAPKADGVRLLKGDIVRLETSGGGGFGDPAARDPADVARDKEPGYA